MSAIQGLSYFDINGTEQLMAAQNGKMFTWDGNAWRRVTGYTPTADTQIEAAQGIDKLIVTDGVQNMYSWNGTAFVDLGSTVSATGSPPVGATIVCWHAGRMFASGQAAASDTVWASFLLDFVAAKWNHTNFKFRVGGGEGDPIKALVSLQNFNLAVLKENSIYVVTTSPSATDVTSSAAASAAAWPVTLLSTGLGCVGRRAWCKYQNDVLFMSQDGVRSLGRMQAAAGQYEIGPPLSRPMQPFINRINWSYAHLIAAKSYKEFCFFAVPLDSATTPNTVLAYNGRLGRWLGIWTAWTPQCWEVTRFGGVQRLVFGELGGRVREWKDTEDQTDDDTFLEDGAPIASKLWTRGMFFGEPVNDKDGYHAEVRFSASNAIVNLTALGDNAEIRQWSHDLRQTGVGLPVDLPFDLVSPAAVTGRRGLRGCAPFNEIFLKLESESGWWALRNCTLSAYLNMLQNQ